MNLSQNAWERFEKQHFGNSVKKSSQAICYKVEEKKIVDMHMRYITLFHFMFNVKLLFKRLQHYAQHATVYGIR